MDAAPPPPDHPLLARVWLAGCGAMGGALLACWRAAGLPDARITVIDPAPRNLPKGFSGHVVADPAAAGPPPTLLVLGIKPQQLAGVAPGLAAAAGAPLLLSMLAGVRLATLGVLFPGTQLVRMMPNTPAAIGRGITALFAPEADAAARAACDWLAQAAGSGLWLDSEAGFDAVTALSGSGPAYLFRFLEGLAAAGAAAGLPPETARQLALETVAGAAELARTSPLDPSELRAQVTSPNGTTAAGLAALDGEGQLSDLLQRTVAAATARSRALAAETEAGVTTATEHGHG